MGNNTSSPPPPPSNSKQHQSSSSSSHSSAAAASSSGHETKRQAKSQVSHKNPNNTSTTTTKSTTSRTTRENVTTVPSKSLGIDQSSSSSSKSPSPANTTTPPKPQPPPQQDIPSRPVPISAGPTIVEFISARSQSHRSSLENPPAQDMSYHLTRPPRLPLPIEEEVHTPGSPIIPPSDPDAPPLGLELDHVEHAELTRKDSQTTETTVDEEDEDAELQLDNTKAVVPTIVEWVGGTERTKVYVTGSIFSWNKKQRLHADPSRPGVFSAIVHVRPGTHHLNFLIDGVMTTSTHLPTTVDFNNHLVNYIEVSPDDIPKSAFPPATKLATYPSSKPPPTPKMKPTIPLTSYTSTIPGYLEDLDLPEDSDPYQRAAAAIDKLPPPPTLPGFLGKPILNAATPMKDDNSVLVFPNHTVLNHLATSSIKNGVLAVSATTRYKKKYVTTIMYKPT